MKEHKGILILLIVIALLVAVAIGRGHQRDRNDKPAHAVDSPGKGFAWVDGIFSGFRKPLDIKRVIGCARAERLLTAAPGGSCDAVIIPLPGAPRVSTAPGRSRRVSPSTSGSSTSASRGRATTSRSSSRPRTTTG